MTAPGVSTASPLLVVAAAVLDADGRVLLAQRPAHKHHGGLWEFPGGKVEIGESPERALLRELREELGVEPCATCLDPFAFASSAIHRAARAARRAAGPADAAGPDAGAADGRDIVLLLYICRRWDGLARGLEGQEIAWAAADQLHRWDMPPLDRDLAAHLRDRLAAPGG